MRAALTAATLVTVKQKTVRSTNGDVELDIPLNRKGNFEPKLVRKSERQLNGFDERTVALYARGMTTHDIQAYLEEAYGVEVSPTFISQVINEVIDEVKAWQHQSRWSISTVWWFAAVTRAWYKISRCIWRLTSTPTVKKSYSACGWLKPKVRSSGYR